MSPEEAVIGSGIAPGLVICGCAEDVDRAGFLWARDHNVPVEFFPAWATQRDWALSVALPEEVVHPHMGRFNMAAGFHRNTAMAERGEALIALWDGRSSGTANMIRAARRCGLRVYIWRATRPADPVR